MERDKCRSCGAAILWLTNKTTGRVAPIDADPSTDGNCVIDGSEYEVMGAGLFGLGNPRHMNHHATCPQSRSWKRKAKGKADAK